jgi:CHAD domain-containing protein
MASAKWISGLTADTPLASAARHVLMLRFETVRDSLPRAIHEADEDPEHVHQLRVGTRRARAALDVFADCLPSEAYKQARRRLRELRRAAGAARDWDVFLFTLAERQHKALAKQRPGLDFLAGHALARRMVAQEQMVEAGQRHPFACDRLLADIVAAVHKPRVNSRTRRLIDLARPVLCDLLRGLEEATKCNLHDYAKLHHVRIAGKRLRYAMEVFADCFEPAFKDDLYPAVEQMQEILGSANDSHVAAGRLQELRDQAHMLPTQQAKRVLPGIDALLRFHQERLRKEREHFEECWTQWGETGGEAALEALLKKPALASKTATMGAAP